MIESVSRAILAVEEARTQLAQAASELKSSVVSVRDRESVVRFTTNAFSDCRVNARECLDPFYYDFPKQARHIGGLFERVGSRGAKDALEEILRRGCYRENGVLKRFHPDFVKQASDIIKQAIRLFESTVPV